VTVVGTAGSKSTVLPSMPPGSEAATSKLPTAQSPVNWTVERSYTRVSLAL
jgi:hypothetical protein